QKHAQVISPLMEAQRQPIRKGKLRVKKLQTERCDDDGFFFVCFSCELIWIFRGHGKDSVTLSCVCFLFNDLLVITHNDSMLEKLSLSLLWINISGNSSFVVLTPEKK